MIGKRPTNSGSYHTSTDPPASLTENFPIGFSCLTGLGAKPMVSPPGFNDLSNPSKPPQIKKDAGGIQLDKFLGGVSGHPGVERRLLFL